MGDSAQHSVVGASSAKRWMTCPGSVQMSQRVPEEQTGYYAAEGTLAHSIGEGALKNDASRDSVLARYLGHTYEVEGHRVEATEEMLDAVWQYVEYVRSVTPPYVGQGACYRALEARHIMDQRGRVYVAPSDYGDTARDRMFGTVECVICDPAPGRLHIIDYKHGAGVYVPAEGNPQLRYYALAALTALKEHEFDQIETVHMTIVQPRHPLGAPIRHDSIDVLDLLEWGRDELIPAAHTALHDPDAPLVPSDECRFCPAAAICPALRQSRMEDAKLAFDEQGNIEPTQDPESLSADELARVLDAAPRIRSWLNAAEKRAREMIEEDVESVPGFKLVQKRATRQWADENKAADRLCEEYGLGDEDIYEQRIQSPAKIEKVVGKGKEARALLDELTVSVSSGHTIAPESDSRPAVDPGNKRPGAADAFPDE